MHITLHQYQCGSSEPKARLESLRHRASACSGTSDVLVCPELYASGYNIGEAAARSRAEPVDGPFNTTAREIARTFDMALIYGYVERAGETIYNSACCIDRDGNLIANHRKLYLSGPYEEATFTTGDRYTVFDLEGIRTGLLICFDVEFPESVRACGQMGCDLVIVPTALQGRWVHLTRTLVPTRAFENGVFLVYANYGGHENELTYCGNSLIVGPDGIERTRAGEHDDSASARVNTEDNRTARAMLPYLEKLEIRKNTPIVR